MRYCSTMVECVGVKTLGEGGRGPGEFNPSSESLPLFNQNLAHPLPLHQDPTLPSSNSSTLHHSSIFLWPTFDLTEAAFGLTTHLRWTGAAFGLTEGFSFTTSFDIRLTEDFDSTCISNIDDEN
ncbi:hypothetical protein Tco_0459641 [Tanacetum coccineum]